MGQLETPAADVTDAQRARLRAATMAYDGDACRPGSGFTPLTIAAAVLRHHFDIARCYCPACVLAREVVRLSP